MLVTSPSLLKITVVLLLTIISRRSTNILGAMIFQELHNSVALVKVSQSPTIQPSFNSIILWLHCLLVLCISVICSGLQMHISCILHPASTRYCYCEERSVILKSRVGIFFGIYEVILSCFQFYFAIVLT